MQHFRKKKIAIKRQNYFFKENQKMPPSLGLVEKFEFGRNFIFGTDLFIFSLIGQSRERRFRGEKMKYFYPVAASIPTRGGTSPKLLSLSRARAFEVEPDQA